MTYETVEARDHGEPQSYYVWKKPFTFPRFFTILEKVCITDGAGRDRELRVRTLPLETALDANSVPPWEALQESGNPCPMLLRS